MLTEQERVALDAKLSWPFKRWDIIIDAKREIIWVFDKVAYHWWDPKHPIGKYIFADFQRAISKQWRGVWHVFPDWCWDDDTYINRRKNDLSANYRFATDAEKRLFNALINRENKK